MLKEKLEIIADLWRVKANRRLILFCSAFVLAWRVFLEIINQIIYHSQPIRPYWPTYLKNLGPPVALTPHGLGGWAHWDGYHFYGLVLYGYHEIGLKGQFSETAFFPAFPYLVRYLSKPLGLNYIIVGLILNFILTIVICITLYKLTNLMIKRYLPKAKINSSKAAKLSLLLFFLYPASFFLVAFYADALVVATATLAIYFGLKEKYLAASLCTMVSIATKSTGAVLVPILILILIENEHVKNIRQLFTYKIISRSILIGCGALVGIGSYMLYLWKSFHNPFLFNQVESLWGRNNSIGFIRVLYDNYYSHMFTPSYFENHYQLVADWILMLLPFAVIALSLWFTLKFKAYWVFVYSFLIMLIPLVSGVMLSLNRYALILTPLFSVFAICLLYHKLNKVYIGLILLSSAVWLVFLTGGFLMGGYGYFAG